MAVYMSPGPSQSPSRARIDSPDCPVACQFSSDTPKEVHAYQDSAPHSADSPCPSRPPARAWYLPSRYEST
ncbi:hypothetical protein BJX61DRAFT_348403 [Aspergillus egyptiacus]|nr:hypothetical protein BJX61DRAFT_348403 [Aspergillus egyptiacus]